MSLSRVYPWPWLLLLLLFAIFEGVPLALGHPEYTLSDYVWRLEALGRPWTFVRYFVAALCIWLAFHLIFGWWR